MTYQLHHGDMLDILPMMERDSIDAIVTDPPYGLGFMGKDWDHGVPGEHFWREVYRVSKPGAHLLAFGGTRTFHRLAVAIEDAGWEIRDCVMWVYGSGFPKSHDVSKAIDREAGAEREIGEPNQWVHVMGQRPKMDTTTVYGQGQTDKRFETLPATPAAAEWAGWGTALKPAWEPIIVARKPLAGTVAENVQRYGTGAMNIDGCRISWQSEYDKENGRPASFSKAHNGFEGKAFAIADRSHRSPIDEQPSQGRWPANLIHDGSAEVLAGFPSPHGAGFARDAIRQCEPSGNLWKMPGDGQRHGDTGSAARFFYCAKASKADRDEGLEDFEASPIIGRDEGQDIRDVPYKNRPYPQRNGHPTVKPTSLMRYLCRLVTPTGGVVLDPFMGSGSTGKAAILEGFNFIGVELELEYLEIAARRIEHACGKVGIVVDQPMLIETRREMAEKPKQLMLL